MIIITVHKCDNTYGGEMCDFFFKNMNAMVCGSSSTLSEEERKMIKMKIIARHKVNSSWHFFEIKNNFKKHEEKSAPFYYHQTR